MFQKYEVEELRRGGARGAEPLSLCCSIAFSSLFGLLHNCTERQLQSPRRGETGEVCVPVGSRSFAAPWRTLV